MDPIVLSPSLLAHLQSLQTKTQQWLKTYAQLRQDADAWARLSTEQQEKQSAQHQKLEALASALVQTLAAAESGSPAPSTRLSALYDRVVELGINMNTKGSPDLAKAYEKAIADFLAAYAAADSATQTTWQQAKIEVEESQATLQAKLKRAEEVLANRRTNAPTGGYFRYVEGTVKDKRYRRLDWIATMVNFRGEAHHLNNDKDNDQYVAGTNRFIIELYTPQPNAKGGLDFVRNGTAYSLSTAALELVNQLTGPYIKHEEGPGGKFPPFEYNNTPKNRNPRWSITLQSDQSGTRLDIDLPTWEDYGAEQLIAQYRIDCANFRLTQSSSDAAIAAINAAIAQQQQLYRTLDAIRQELEARPDHKLDQQGEEIVALLAIWREKITGFQTDVSGLDFRNCIQPPLAINVAINYWTAALTNPSQAIADLQAAGVLTRLRTFPNAQIQITATFNYGTSKDRYMADPTAYMDEPYKSSDRTKYSIPNTIQVKRDYLAVKANNLRDLIVAQSGIVPNQVVANTTPGDTGPHVGDSTDHGNRMDITWLRNQ